MVHKIPLMLGQLLNINPGNLQDMPPHDDQNIRQVRRNTLRRNQYLYDRQYLGLEHIRAYVVGFNGIIWHIMIQLIIILIIMKIILIPLSIRENGNRKYTFIYTTFYKMVSFLDDILFRVFLNILLNLTARIQKEKGKKCIRKSRK